MHLEPFRYFAPNTVSEFFEIVAQCGRDEYAVMAGGTDALLKIRQRLISPSGLISLNALSELKRIGQEGGDIVIGAAVPLYQIIESTLIRKHLPALAQAAGWVASPQIRQMGTIGGNICLDTRCLFYNQPASNISFPPCFKRGGDKCHVVKNAARCYALFCADTPPALLSLDAKLVIADASGRKEVPLSEFYRDDGLSCRRLRSEELLVAVKIRIDARLACSYRRFSPRRAIDFPLVGAAVCLSIGPDGDLNNIRIAATGIQSRPLRLKAAEGYLNDTDLRDPECTKNLMTELKQLQIVRHQDIAPSYRRELLKVLIEQNIHQCIRKGGDPLEAAG